MGELFIGGDPPANLGAIDRLYAGDELVWPNTPMLGWQSGATLTNLTFGGAPGAGALVNFNPTPTGLLATQTVATITGGEDTFNGFEYFTPVETDIALGKFFRVTVGNLPGAWRAIESFLFPPALQFSVTDAAPTVTQAGQFEFADTNGGPVQATVTFDITLTFVPATSGFVTMNNARVESRTSSANFVAARLVYNTNGNVTPNSSGGTMTSFGIRNWWFGTPIPTEVWARWRVVTQNGGALVVTRNSNGSNINQNAWFNMRAAAAQGMQFELSSSGSNAYNRWVDLEVEFSFTNGGPIEATSTFRLQVIKT